MDFQMKKRRFLLKKAFYSLLTGFSTTKFEHS